MKSFLALFVFIALLSTTTAVEVALGANAAISANTETTITFTIIGIPIPILQLDVTFNADTNVNFDAFTSATLTSALAAQGAASLSSGFLAFSPGTFLIGGSAAVGFNLASSNVNAGVTGITLTFPTLLFEVGSGLKSGLLYWDASVKAFAFIKPTSFDVSSTTFTLPRTGIYALVQFDSSVAVDFPALFNLTVDISNQKTSFAYPEGFLISVSAAVSNSFSVNFFATNPKKVEPADKKSLNKYIDIALTAEATVDAAINFKVNDDTDVNTVVIGFFDVATNDWNFPDSGLKVDANAKVVTQTTTHFSTWGVYAKTSSAARAVFSVTLLLVALFFLLL